MCALTIGYVPLHGCFLTIKRLTLQDVVTASSAGLRMGPSNRVEKGKGEKCVGYENGSLLPSPSLSEGLSIFLPSLKHSSLLAKQMRCSLMFSHQFSSLLLPFPGFMFNCK